VYVFPESTPKRIPKITVLSTSLLFLKPKENMIGFELQNSRSPSIAPKTITSMAFTDPFCIALYYINMWGNTR
jgi:hypothetical protein